MVALDFLLILLTSACIIYCMLLNRRIIQIQKYRSDMLKIFKEFDKTVEKAEKILIETKEIAPASSKIIAELENKMLKQSEKLESLISKADLIADDLETLIISGNRIIGKLSSNEEKGQLSFDKIEEETIEEDDEPKTKKEKESIQLSQLDYYGIIQEKRKNRR